jgi:hypothetical protein
MNITLNALRQNAQRDMERRKHLEPRLEGVSRAIWPWSERKLAYYVLLVAALDYLSTYVFLALSSNKYLAEGGPLAGWALQQAGFLGLFLMDAAAIISLVLLALILRSGCTKLGFKGIGRTAFVTLLVPYFVVTLAVVYHNLLVAFFL